MNRLAALALAALACLPSGCDDDDASAGASGGICRTGPAPCDDDLICVSGTCQSPDDADASLEPEQLRITFKLEKTTLDADGEDQTTIQVRVYDAETGAPVVGEAIITLDPPNGGEVNPARQLLNQGLAGFRLVACDADEESCPERFTVYLSLASRPLEPITRGVGVTLNLPEIPDAALDSGAE